MPKTLREIVAMDEQELDSKIVNGGSIPKRAYGVKSVGGGRISLYLGALVYELIKQYQILKAKEGGMAVSRSQAIEEMILEFSELRGLKPGDDWIDPVALKKAYRDGTYADHKYPDPPEE